MTACTVEECYWHYIGRTDVRINYRGRQIVALDPIDGSTLYRAWYNEYESTIVERAAVVIVQQSRNA